MADFIYDKEVLEVFLRNQGQLFDEPVANTPEEADEFLDMMFATVVANEDEVREYFEESGIDVDENIMEAAEVFELNDGRFLIVEG